MGEKREMAEKNFTRQELSKYNGDDNEGIFIAYQGIVYDVTLCLKWRSGLHENQHFPGQDLTSEMVDAPHSEDVFSRPCVRQVGRLIN